MSNPQEGPREVKKPEETQKNEYVLTERERAQVQGLNTLLMNAKAAVFDANVGLEEAQIRVREELAKLQQVQAQFHGALGMIAAAHDMNGAEFSPDLSRMTRKR